MDPHKPRKILLVEDEAIIALSEKKCSKNSGLRYSWL